MHAHHYVQYGFCGSTTIEINSPDWTDSKHVRSFIIPSDVPHQIRLYGKDRVLMVWLDPEFQLKRSIFNSTRILTSLGELEMEVKSFNNRQHNCDVARQIRELITGWPTIDSSDKLDERIYSCIAWIKKHLTERTITTEDLARTVFLSPSRLMHLFPEQIGIPIRKYILWQRLRHALLQLAEGVTISGAAHAAGFTDSPHMNRTFKAMFGITPTKIFKNSRFVQVIAC